MKKKVLLLISIFTLLNVILFIADLKLGDGDGIIASISYNPLLIGVTSLTVLALVSLIFHKNQVLSNTGLALGSVVFTLLLGEIALTMFVPHKSNAETIMIKGDLFLTRFDTIFFKNYIPLTKYKTRLLMDEMDEFVINEINSIGIRGPEIEDKEDSTFRYLFIGDSYLQSDEITYDSMVGQRVERLLGHGYDVVQHGIPSWSPLLEWNWAIKMMPQINMDGIVLFLYYNDFVKGNFVGDTGYTNYCLFNDKNEPVGFKFSSSNKPFLNLKSLWSSSRIYQLLMQKQKVFNEFEMPPSQLIELDSISYRGVNKSNSLMSYLSYGLIDLCRDTSIWDVDIRERVGTSLNYISGFNNWCQEKNIAFSIVLIPTAFQLEAEGLGFKESYGFSNDYILPRGGLVDQLERFCQTNEIPFLPLIDRYRLKNKAHQQLYFKYDMHWNNYGHNVTAEEVYRFISKTPDING